MFFLNMHCTQLLNYNLIIILLEQRHFEWLDWCFKIQAKNVSSWNPKKSSCFISLCVSHQHMVEKVESIAQRPLSSGFIKVRAEWKYCCLQWVTEHSSASCIYSLMQSMYAESLIWARHSVEHCS